MARLDARRLDAWRSWQLDVRRLERRLDDGLREQWDISLAWFEVLAGLQRRRGRARPSDLADDLAIPPSSLSRRLDRLAEEGWVARQRVDGDRGDARAVVVELTATGRRLWREMNVTYRRLVQQQVAGRLDDEHISAIEAVVTALQPALGREDADAEDGTTGDTAGRDDWSPGTTR
ncbi:MAG: MarR family transcriptional regulator [Actinomycetota bacterium]